MKDDEKVIPLKTYLGCVEDRGKMFWSITIDEANDIPPLNKAMFMRTVNMAFGKRHLRLVRPSPGE